MKDYFVGVNIDQNRGGLEQAVAAVIEKLKNNTLPGITAERVAAMFAVAIGGADGVVRIAHGRNGAMRPAPECFWFDIHMVCSH